MDWATTTARGYKKYLSFGIWCDLYKRFYGSSLITCSSIGYRLSRAPLCYGDVKWASGRLKSPATQVFIRNLISVNNKEITKSGIADHLYGNHQGPMDSSHNASPMQKVCSRHDVIIVAHCVYAVLFCYIITNELGHITTRKGNNTIDMISTKLWYKQHAIVIWRCNQDANVSSSWLLTCTQLQHIGPLQWRHNGRDDISNHQLHFCLLTHSGADPRKHQSSASLAFVRGIHRWPMNSPHKWPVTQKMLPFDDVIMEKSV